MRSVHPLRAPAGYWVAGVVAALGLVVAVGWAAASAWLTLDDTEGFLRSDVPGTVSATVEQGGTRVIYFEGDAAPSVQDLGLEVVDPRGEPVDLEAYPGTLQYDVPGSAGVLATAVARFEAPAGGTYEVSAATAPVRGAGMAVGEDLAGAFVRAMLGPALVAVASVAAALAVAVVTATGTRRAPAVGR